MEILLLNRDIDMKLLIFDTNTDIAARLVLESAPVPACGMANRWALTVKMN